MLKKKIIPVFLASVLTVSGTTGFVTEAFSENVYAAEEVHTERLADFADLLDDGQKEELRYEQAVSLSERSRRRSEFEKTAHAFSRFFLP